MALCCGSAMRIALDGTARPASEALPVVDDMLVAMKGMAHWHPFYANSADVPCYLEYMRTALCAKDGHSDGCRHEYLRLKTCFAHWGVATHAKNTESSNPPEC